MGNLALFLADCYVYADKVAALLVDYGVEADCCFSGGAVSYYQFALAAAYGDHGVYGLNPCLNRLVDGLTRHHVGSYFLYFSSAGGLNGAFPVQGAAEWVNHPSDEGFADGYFNDPTCGTDPLAFFHCVWVT